MLLKMMGSVAAVVPLMAVAELARILLDVYGVDTDGADAGWPTAVASVGLVALLIRFALVFGASAVTHFAEVDLFLLLHLRCAPTQRLGRLVPG